MLWVVRLGLVFSICAALAPTGPLQTHLDPHRHLVLRAAALGEHEQGALSTQQVAASDLSSEFGRSGCCSHHGGVCGCKDGRALCCDGVKSPTCGCD